MRLNLTTLANILLILLVGGGLWLVERHELIGEYQIYIVKLIFINAILALSLNLIYGFTGLFSLGHAGFMAIGAYVGALCTLLPEQKEMMWILDPIIWPFSVLSTPFWVAVLAGGVVAMIFAFIIAVPVLRLGDDYLGIATLGFAEIIRVFIVNLASVTNGSLGIKGIPGEATLLTCYVWMIITLVVLARLLFGNFGNVLRCIRDNEIAANVMGINIFSYKVLSFCLGAFFAGVGGALLGSHLSTIDPKMFNFLLTFNVLMFVVAGGLGSLTGSLLGAGVITVLLEWLRAIEEPMDFGLFEIPGIPGMRMVVFSLVLLLIILFLCHWALIAFSKIYVYQIPEDTLLAASTVPAIYLFFKNYFDQNLHKETKPSARFMNGFLIVICAVIGVALSITLLHGLLNP